MPSSLHESLRVGLVYLILMVLTMGGCADSRRQEHPGQDGDQDAKTSSGAFINCDSVFYITGPQQATPPNGTFKAGTRIEVIQEAGSYTLVCAQDGRQGYVSSDAITVP